MVEPNLDDQIRELWHRSVGVQRSTAPPLPTDEPRWLGRRAIVVASLCLVLGVVAIAVSITGSDPSVTTAADAPEQAVAERAAGLPGTEIGDGFEVVEGSVLVGTRIPLPQDELSESVEDAGWEALLYVDGDPREVVDRYLGQATEQGLTSGPRVELRTTPTGVTEHPTTANCWESQAAGSYHCNAVALASDGARCLLIDLVRSESASHMRLQLHTSGSVLCTEASPIDGDPATEPPAVPSRWPERPTTGEPFGQAYPFFSGLRIQPGSELVAAPVVADFDLYVTYAVLEVTGEPTAVFDRYVQALQLTETSPNASPRTIEVEGDDRRLRRHVLNVMAGGPTYWVDLVTTETQGNWLYLSAGGG